MSSKGKPRGDIDSGDSNNGSDSEGSPRVMSDFQLNVGNDDEDDAFARDFYVDPSQVLNSGDLPLPDITAQAKFH